MNTIFDYINDILYHKKGTLIDNIEHESSYNPYMINRWLSMYSPQVATVVNFTSNRLYSIFETKAEAYNFMVNVMPHSSPRRIKYIKKNKTDKKEEEEIIGTLASNLELSKREINYYIEQSDLDIEGIKKSWEC
tara:strand:- start:1103 stop:1504 length:402 start_codon:yes stop_codon:yes gene_type:complete